jgi:hypothetical protein
MSSQPVAAAVEADPNDDLLWRYPPRRLEAEAIRDLVLATSGQLNLARGGTSVYPKVSAEVLATQSRPGTGWEESTVAERNRRSVYIFIKRTLLVPEMEVLDFPDTNSACEQRIVSTVAPQALTWFNGDFIVEQAKHFAERLEREAGAAAADQVALAYRLALARPVTEAEQNEVLHFLSEHAAQIRAERTDATEDAARHEALAAFCRVLLNTNEFVYLR